MPGKYLFVFILTSFLVTGISYSEHSRNTMSHGPAPQQNFGDEPTGEELAAQWGCKGCHGQDFGGGKLAPSLLNLSETYTREKMISYLKNPKAFLNEPRLKELKKLYKITMPGFEKKDEKQISLVAYFILSLQHPKK